MGQTIVGLAVALAAAVSAAPASACGYSGCSSPSWNYNYSGFYGNYSTPVSPCATACGGYSSWGYGRLPYPAQPYATLPQYYWVNQGPTYTGPGLFAPAPTYQERAVSGWQGYGPTAYGTTNYSYSGGPYGNATTHYYDGMPAGGYSGYSYQSYSHLPPTYGERSEEEAPAPVYRPYYGRPMYHYGRPYHRVFAPRFMAPRYVAPYARPRLGLRYGMPHMMVRGGYTPRMGYVPMPPRRMYRPMGVD